MNSMQSFTFALWFLLTGAAGNDVWHTPVEGGPIIGFYGTKDYRCLDVHVPTVNPLTGRYGMDASDFAIARAPLTGTVYLQHCWWELRFDDVGQMEWYQDCRHWVLYTP